MRKIKDIIKLIKRIFRNSSLFFDYDYYADNAQLKKSHSHFFLLIHYLLIGSFKNLAFNPYIDNDYYIAENRDGNFFGNPLLHLLHNYDKYEYIKIHPLLDLQFYERRYSEVKKEDSFLLDFLQHGDKNCYQPSAEFDVNFYADCYLPLEQYYPLKHYILFGKKHNYLLKPKEPGLTQEEKDFLHQFNSLHKTVVVCSHDAQKAGAPILLLDIINALKKAEWNILIILKKAGPLLEEFKKQGKVFILAEGYSFTEILSHISTKTKILCNTVVCANLAAEASSQRFSTFLLVHEMPEFALKIDALEPLKEVAQNNGKIIFPFNKVKESFEKYFAEEVQKNLLVLRPGLKNFEQNSTQQKKIRKQYSIANNHLVFISGGYADYRKGFDLFLEIVENISMLLPHAKFIWLGEMGEWAKSLLNNSPLKDKLILPGYVENMIDWFAVSSAFVLTSRQDTGHAVCLYAASVGVGFVGYKYDIGIMDDLPEFIGEFIEPDNQQEMIHKLINIAQNDSLQNKKKRMEFIKANASLEIYYSNIISLLNK